VRVVLVRHADAGDPDPARHPDDRLRPLTARGEREHAEVAAALARFDLRATHVLTSPLVRARQTAEITARALGVAAVAVVDALGDRFSLDGVLDEFAGLPPSAVVVCVGHEPNISRLAATLLHADGHVQIAFPKSAVMALDCQGRAAPGSARLTFFVTPREVGLGP
jgi:phosphohistidine phosphatase